MNGITEQPYTNVIYDNFNRLDLLVKSTFIHITVFPRDWKSHCGYAGKERKRETERERERESDRDRYRELEIAPLLTLNTISLGVILS